MNSEYEERETEDDTWYAHKICFELFYFLPLFAGYGENVGKWRMM